MKKKKRPAKQVQNKRPLVPRMRVGKRNMSKKIALSKPLSLKLSPSKILAKQHKLKRIEMKSRKWVDYFSNMSRLAMRISWTRLITSMSRTFNRNKMIAFRGAFEDRMKVNIMSKVPHEITLKILSYLPAEDICRVSQTCRYLRAVCTDKYLWRDKCRTSGIIADKQAMRILLNDSSSPGTSDNAFKIDEFKQHIDWKRIYSGHSRIIRNWYREDTFQSMKQLKCHEKHVITCLQFNPISNIIVSGSDDNTLKVWSAITGKCLMTLKGHKGGVWCSQIANDGTVISGSTDRTIRVWDIDRGETKYIFTGHSSTVRCLALEGNRVVSGSRDTTLRLWNINKGVCKHVFVGHDAAVRCVEFKNGLIVSGAYDNLVKVWNADTHECIHTLVNHSNRIYCLQFDGKMIASGSLDTTICIWDAITGELKHELRGHSSLTSKMLLKDNLLISANADSFCKVWDVQTGKCLHTLGGPNKHSSAITSVYLNSWYIITSGDDGTVKLWDRTTGEFIRDLVRLKSASEGGLVWRIKASYTKLICAVGSRTELAEDTHLLVVNLDDRPESLTKSEFEHSMLTVKHLVNHKVHPPIVTVTSPTLESAKIFQYIEKYV